MLCTMIIFIAVFVLLMNILQVSGVKEEEDVLYFEDIQSDQPRVLWVWATIYLRVGPGLT